MFKLLHINVDVAFKLSIDNVEISDKLFKLLKIVVDVTLVYKLMILHLVKRKPHQHLNMII